MRLTLRTMLAYMNGILAPEDAQEIAKKIQESPAAAELLNRTRDVVRRLRLAAPGLAGPGSGLDPNTVAEYLDHQLPDDRVADFEKVCLESDVQLAEVAACHQILTLVLGEPAEVDPASRDRMYQLGSRFGATASPTPAPSAAAQPGTVQTHSAAEGQLTSAAEPAKAADAEPAVKTRTKPTIPDYLRDPPARNKLFPIALGAAVVVVFVLVVLAVFGQFAPGTPLGRILGYVMPAEEDNQPVEPVIPASPKQPGAVKPSDSDIAEKGKLLQQPAVADPSSKLVRPGEEPAPMPPGEAGEPKPAEPSAPLPPEPAQPAEKPDAPEKPGEGKPQELGEPKPPEPPTEVAVRPPIAIEPVPVPKADVPQQAGRLMSDDRQVLLRYDAQSEEWYRVPSKGILDAQTWLLTLPAYRTQLALSTAGVAVEMLGGAKIQLLPKQPQHPAGFNVAYGRLVVMPLANAGTTIRLTAGEVSGSLCFLQAESKSAIEVIPRRNPGADPEKHPRAYTVTIYGCHGGLTWQEDGSAEVIELTAPCRFTLGSKPVAEDVPKWVVGDTAGLLDARAAAIMAPAIQPTQPARLKLLEFADDPQRREVRWLARRCLAYLDTVEPLVAPLAQLDAQREWPDYLAQLAEAIDRSPQSAAAIRLSLEKLWPREASTAYRMLWGYTDKDLEAGEDAALVRALEHDSLVVRVLAWWTLKEITGLTFAYRPELPPAKRDAAVKKWRERQAAGQIRHAQPGVKPVEPPGEGDLPGRGAEL